MKGHDSIRGSGPFTIDQPREAAVFEGCDCLILTSPLSIEISFEKQTSYSTMLLALTLTSYVITIITVSKGCNCDCVQPFAKGEI